MKIKKVLALILALTMCLCMFAVMPTVSAAGSSLWENVVEEGGYRAGDSSIVPPEDYEYIEVDSNERSHLVTKSAYDVMENTLILSNLNLDQNKSIRFAYAPYQAKYGESTSGQYETDNGILNFYLTNTGTGLKYTVRLYDGNSDAVFLSNQISNSEIPYANEYRISFVVDQGVFKLKINNWYMRHYVNGVSVNGNYTQEHGSERYITIATDYRASANVRIANNYELNPSAWENLIKEGGYRIQSSIKAPEGYEHIEIDSNDASSLVTKKKCDVRETSIVLSDLDVPVGKFVAFIFAPHQAKLFEQPANKDAATDGFFTFYLYNNGSKYIYHAYFFHNNGGPYDFSSTQFGAGTCDIPYADEYEISLLYTAETKAYKLRINNWYMSDWLNGLTGAYSDSNGYERYITIATNDRATANVKIVNNDDVRSRWVACAGNLKDYSGNVTDYDATELRLMNSDRSRVASLARYNMLENTLVLDDIVFPPQSGSGQSTRISFSAKTRYAKAGGTYVAEDQRLSFNFEPYEYADSDGDGVKETVTKIRVAMANWTLQYPLNLANRYELGFRKINGTYYLYLNDEKITNDHIQGFCAAGYAENCYIGFDAANYLCADMTVVDSNGRKNEWISTNGTFYKNVVGNTDDVRKVTSSSSIVTVSKYDLLHGNMTLRNTNFSLEPKAGGGYNVNSVIFGSYASNTQVTEAGRLVCTTLTPKTVNNGVLTKVDVCVKNTAANGGGLIPLGTIDAATDYTYRFSKEDDAYILYVNGVAMAENTLITGLGNAGVLEDCYVSLVTEGELTAIPVFTESTWEQIGANAGANWTVADNDAVANVVLSSGAFIRSSGMFDISSTCIAIDNLDCGYDAEEETDPLAILTFAKNKTVAGGASSNSRGYSLGFRYVYDEDSDEEFIKVLHLNSVGVWEELADVDMARTYEISFAYSLSNDSYVLNINDEHISLMNNDETLKFLANGSKDVYIIFGAENYDITADKVTVSETVAYGDVDGDSQRDIMDMVMIARGMASGNDKADANQDGNVNIQDTDIIRKIWFANGFNFIQ